MTAAPAPKQTIFSCCIGIHSIMNVFAQAAATSDREPTSVPQALLECQVLYLGYHYLLLPIATLIYYDLWSSALCVCLKDDTHG
jgi:hypothetical protein